MYYYQVCVLIILLVLFLIFLWNLYVIRERKIKKIDDIDLPFVSVLIPARNEEKNIEQCVISLLNQDYPNYEVIVLNDHSTDNTGSLLSLIKDKYPHLQIIIGAKLPDGWIGKSFACHQLSKSAKGKWLLFTDADTVHEKNSIRIGVETAISRNADLLSIVPHQITITFFEKLIIPILHFVTFTMLPFYFLEKKGYAKFTIAVGQYMLFKRSSFDKIGGYETVKNKIVEDVEMGRLIKRNKLQLIVLNADSIVSCRMYRNFNEILEGFSKNIFAGVGFSTPLIIFILILYIILFVLPYFYALYLIFAVGFTLISILAILQVAIILLVRMALCIKFKQSLLSAILHPFGIFMVIFISINSWRLVTFTSGPQWKGRTYKLK